MKHYEVEVTSTIGGYISVNAESSEEAKIIIEKAISDLGFEALNEKLYNNHQKKYADFTGSEITHREHYIYPEVISDEAFDTGIGR
jgi:hypothetical protein